VSEFYRCRYRYDTFALLCYLVYFPCRTARLVLLSSTPCDLSIGIFGNHAWLISYELTITSKYTTFDTVTSRAITWLHHWHFAVHNTAWYRRGTNWHSALNWVLMQFVSNKSSDSINPSREIPPSQTLFYSKTIRSILDFFIFTKNYPFKSIFNLSNQNGHCNITMHGTSVRFDFPRTNRSPSLPAILE